MKLDHKPSFVDIFCGCGVMSECFDQAGFDVLLGLDADRWAIETYNKHHLCKGRKKNVEDIDARQQLI
jgi:site-specific DNA-cytosine methylase